MIAGVAPAVRDPTLYRAFALAGWYPREPEEKSRARLQRTRDALKRLEWSPDDAHLPEARQELAWSQRKLWHRWPDEIDEWNVHRFAQGYHKELIVLLGVEQHGPQPATADWVEAARERWGALLERKGTWESATALPDDANPETRPRLLGQGWVRTGEWEAEPTDGWEAFGQERYGEGGFALFPWGLLGYVPAGELDPSRFELHTTVELKAGRDRFLLSDLTVLLLAFLKATEYLRPRYEKSLGWLLDKREQEVLAMAESIPGEGQRFSLGATEGAVRRQTALLFDFSQSLGGLEEDAHSVEVARDTITEMLKMSGASMVGASLRARLVQPVERLARQMRSDLPYFRTTEERGRRALEAHATLVEIEETRGQDQLAMAALILGTFLGVGQIIQALHLGVRLAWVALGLVGVGVFWLLFGLRRR